MKSLEERNQEKLDAIISTDLPTHCFHDLTGKKFGMLKVLRYMGKIKNSQSVYECQCDCGNIYYCYSGVLTRKNRKHLSCGCIRQYHMKDLAKIYHPIKHGDGRRGHHTRLFNIWQGMRQRCNNPNDQAYKNYGERGIKVCPEWDNIDTGYITFKEWALANGYVDNLTIDRIDIDFGYFPENCRWVDYKLQENNRRNNHYVQIGRYIFSVAIWINIIGIKQRTVSNRRTTLKWNIIDSLLTVPNQPKGTYFCDINVTPEYEIYNKYEEFLKKGIAYEFNEDSGIRITEIEVPMIDISQELHKTEK